MAVSTDQFVDRLRRALNMEEAMANQIAGIMDPDALPDSLPASDREKLRQGLSTVRNDTAIHARIVGELISKFSKGAP